MSTTTIRPGLTAAADDDWLARKLLEAGFGGPDCDFPDCTNARAPRSKGKPGPPPKFCVQHNNARDRQIAYRARKALEKERARQPEPEPVQLAVARGAREQQVLADLLPRVLTALEAVHRGQQAGADTAAVAAHLAEVQQTADERVRQAEQHREDAVQDAGAAREEAARSETAAEHARTERQAALLEASCALGEAAAAERRATADRAALDKLSEKHGRLRDAHQELTGAHRQLQARFGEQEAALTRLTGEHNRLLTDHGRLQAAKQIQDTRVEELSGEKSRLEEEQRHTAAELAAAQSEITGLTARLDELQAHREELKDENARLSARLDEEREQHHREMAALRAQLDTTQAAAAQEPTPDGSDGDGAVPAQLREPDEGEPDDANGDVEDAGSAGSGRVKPTAIVDLGVHGGSGWTLVRYEDDLGRWRVLCDGEIAGSVQPEHSLHSASLLGWSARTAGRLPLRAPHGHRYFANREQAAGAVIRDGLRRASGLKAAAAAAAFTSLTEPDQAELVAAVIPLVTATAARGGRLARLPVEVRDAALRTALRVPGEQDLDQLTTVDPAALGRGKDARRFMRALLLLLGHAETRDETGPVDLGTIGGRAWRLEPDPHYEGGYRVLADGAEVGAIAPVLRRKTKTVRWTAEHRRRTLPAGNRQDHADRDAAVRAVAEAEDAWVPLPDLDDEAYLRIPAGLRSELYLAASRIDLRRGRLAQIQPGPYRHQLHAAIGQARRGATGRIGGRHLSVLLDVAREDLGAPGSKPAQRLYDVLQHVRSVLRTGSTTPSG